MPNIVVSSLSSSSSENPAQFSKQSRSNYNCVLPDEEGGAPTAGANGDPKIRAPKGRRPGAEGGPGAAEAGAGRTRCWCGFWGDGSRRPSTAVAGTQPPG